LEKQQGTGEREKSRWGNLTVRFHFWSLCQWISEVRRVWGALTILPMYFRSTTKYGLW
jgi:hypothetical protein